MTPFIRKPLVNSLWASWATAVVSCGGVTGATASAATSPPATTCEFSETRPGILTWRNCSRAPEDSSYREGAIPGHPDRRPDAPGESEYRTGVRRAATVANWRIWSETEVTGPSFARALAEMHSSYVNSPLGSMVADRWALMRTDEFSSARILYEKAKLRIPQDGLRVVLNPDLKWQLPALGYFAVDENSVVVPLNFVQYTTLDPRAFAAAFDQVASDIQTIKSAVGANCGGEAALIRMAYLLANMWPFPKGNWGVIYVLIEQARAKLGRPARMSDGLDYWMMFAQNFDSAKDAFLAWEENRLTEALNAMRDSAIYEAVRRQGFTWSPDPAP